MFFLCFKILTMKKTIIKKSITINATKEKVWNALADFGNVQVLSPNIIKSYSTSEAKNGVGATRHCDLTVMGAQLEERITEWNDGDSIAIELYETKNVPMTTGMNAYFKVTDQGEKTLLSGTFKYEMTNAFGDLMNSLTMKKINEKSWVKFMAGIKHHVETGEDVDKKTKLDLSAVQA